MISKTLLQYSGRAKYNITPKSAPCATGASGTSIAISGVTGATILSKEGTASPTIGTNAITFTSGTLYNLKLVLTSGKVLTMPFSEGSGTLVFGYDDSGTAYGGTVTASNISAFWAGKQNTYFHGLVNGYSDGGVVDIITNGNFASWSGDNPVGYQVLNENSTNYVTQVGNACRMVGDLSTTIAIRPNNGGGFTVGNPYDVSLDIIAITGILSLGGQNFTTIGAKAFTWVATATFLQVSRGGVVDTTFTNLKAFATLPSTVQVPANPYNAGVDCIGSALTYAPGGINGSCKYAFPPAWDVINALPSFYNSGVPIEKTLDEIKALGVGPRFYLGARVLAIYSVDQT